MDLNNINSLSVNEIQDTFFVSRTTAKKIYNIYCKFPENLENYTSEQKNDVYDKPFNIISLNEHTTPEQKEIEWFKRI
jgi:hypothetical protein|tara:strand:- start:2796 stop:3029 length:234 start_codon:yes stop_codon:yes gene_type:complete